ncbi:hypothetical protein PHMEG_0001816 [Phytophthora megakarya]|uniref:Uncharacterized protein n=1 Tax=Phytophthora megakarya TaxID=4795 RepID=A0A225X233_9STRA|nr:hypothetical protein PHMEG_0001816 [Phytophthora megakarya]
MPKVTAIVWKNLPLHKVAAFYETPDCTYRDGYFTFNTGSTRTQVSGRQPYEGHPKRIRSMMLGRNEAALLEEKLKKPTSISHTCNLIRNGLFDTTTLGANETQPNATYEVQWMNDEGSFGGLSANWSDSLPDGSDQTGSTTGGTYDDEDTGIGYS